MQSHHSLQIHSEIMNVTIHDCAVCSLCFRNKLLIATSNAMGDKTPLSLSRRTFSTAGRVSSMERRRSRELGLGPRPISGGGGGGDDDGTVFVDIGGGDTEGGGGGGGIITPPLVGGGGGGGETVPMVVLFLGDGM